MRTLYRAHLHRVLVEHATCLLLADSEGEALEQARLIAEGDGYEWESVDCREPAHEFDYCIDMGSEDE